VTVRFKQAEPAEACVSLMDGRFFGGNKLAAHMWDGFTQYHGVSVKWVKGGGAPSGECQVGEGGGAVPWGECQVGEGGGGVPRGECQVGEGGQYHGVSVKWVRGGGSTMGGVPCG
jgi:hypothetical protein